MAQPATETPPSPVVMMQLLFGKQLTYSLSAVARLGVTDHLGEGDAPSLGILGRPLLSLGIAPKRKKRRSS